MSLISAPALNKLCRHLNKVPFLSFPLMLQNAHFFVAEKKVAMTSPTAQKLNSNKNYKNVSLHPT